VHNLANVIVSCLYVLELFKDHCSPIKAEDFILCVENGIVQLKHNVAITECTDISSAVKRPKIKTVYTFFYSIGMCRIR